MGIFNVSWLGVILGTVVAYAIGGLWYGPFFGKKWMKEVGHTEESIKAGNPWVPMVVQFIATFLLVLLVFNLVDFGGYPLLILAVLVDLGIQKAQGMFRGDSKNLLYINLGYRTVIYVIATIFQFFF